MPELVGNLQVSVLVMRVICQVKLKDGLYPRGDGLLNTLS